jgi:hypothetical protein
MDGGPDFICVGMQKGGTGWLYDQLQFHPEFWMPPMKEIRYLDRDITRSSRARNVLKKARKAPRRQSKKLARRRQWDERDTAFLEQVAGYRGDPMDLERYASLFRFKGALKSGDVTPGYAGLKEDVIARIASRFPDLRVIFLVRDPIARVWSQISMAQRNDHFDMALLDDLPAFKAFLETSEHIQRAAYPARVASRWAKSAPAIAFRHFFFDDIVANPAQVRREVLIYLGADPDKNSGELDAEHNRKSSAEKLDLTNEVRAVLIEHFRDEILATARIFSGHAQTWAANYNL